MSLEWEIYTEKGLAVHVTEEGFVFSSNSQLKKNNNWSGLFLAIKEIETAEWGEKLSDSKFVIYHSSIYQVQNELNLEILNEFCDACPYALSVKSLGSIGRSNFKIDIEYVHGNNTPYIERKGVIAKHRSDFYWLQEEHYLLVENIDLFNQTYDSANGLETEYMEVLAKITSGLKLVGVSGDEFIQGQEIRILSKVKPDIFMHDQDFMSLFPSLGSDIDNEWRQVFFSHDDVKNLYVIETARGRTRVLIPDTLRPLLEDIQKVRRVGGETKLRILANISSVFQEGVNFNLLDITLFSDRVVGITETPANCSVKAIGGNREWFGVAEPQVKSESEDNKNPLIFMVEIQTVNGKEISLELTKQEFIIVFQQAANDIKNGREISSIEYEGEAFNIILNEPLIEIINSIFSVGKNKITYKFLEVISNEDSLDYTGVRCSEDEEEESILPILPSQLKEAYQLKNYQKEGLAWMQRMLKPRSNTGILLADEMGLGKTLQLLSFIAWAISDSKLYPKISKKEPPYDPILIACPLALVDNWESEISKFFQNSESLFLHKKVDASQIKKLKLKEYISQGQELQLAKASLDLERLREYRVIITNYHMIRNYQHSFAKINWSMVITDESQQLKNRNQIYDSFRALKANLKICVTGTPVENSLEDLWHIFDYAQPGLLASKKDFRANFSGPLFDCIENEDLLRQGSILKSLREKLRYTTKKTHLLRRDKSELDLPKIEYIPIRVGLLPLEREAIRRVFLNIAAEKADEKKGAHLSALSEIHKLSVHPMISKYYQAEDEGTSDFYIESSGKFQELVTLLNEIKNKNEKVLIFSELRKSHSILRSVVKDRFGLDLMIISGETPTGNAKNSRLSIIEKFSSVKGFNVIVLSPKAAGVGLNITEANHVIHLDRWWNPALEQQANARTWRIGQTRPVKVYHFIQYDPNGEFTTYDENLDILLSQKSKVSKDFLVPTMTTDEASSKLIEAFTKISSNLIDDEILDFNSIYKLTHQEFEALAVAIFKKQNTKVALTPVSGDQGADVIAISSDEIFYIQAKHSKLSDSILDFKEDSKELDRAYEYYENNILIGKSTNLKRRLILFTNKKQKYSLIKVQSGEIEIWEQKKLTKLLKDFKITYADICKAEAKRLSSLNECKDILM